MERALRVVPRSPSERHGVVLIPGEEVLDLIVGSVADARALLELFATSSAGR